MSSPKKGKRSSRRDFFKIATVSGLGTAILPDYLMSANLAAPEQSHAGFVLAKDSRPAWLENSAHAPVDGKFKATFTTPPKLVSTRKVVYDPMIGNGDARVLDRQGDAPPFANAGTTILTISWVDSSANLGDGFIRQNFVCKSYG